MGIRYNSPAAVNANMRNAMQQKAQAVTRELREVTRNDDGVTRNEFDALKAEVAKLSLLVVKLTAPSTNKRATYMREYRKRPKP